MTQLSIATSRTVDDDIDRTLVSQFSSGDPAALDALFDRHRESAFAVAYRFLGNESDALDAVQDGFVNVLTHIGRFREGCSFRNWLLRIVSNAAIDIARKRRRRQGHNTESLDHLVSPETEPGSEVDREDLRIRLSRALEQLPIPFRRTFVLHADGGMTYREVAESLGISLGTVMSRIFSARKKLRALLAEETS